MTDFVLIHGAYQGGWIWKFVSERLRAKGHNVLAPTLDGCGERASQIRAGITTETHGEEIAKLLYFHDLKDAVLVGTSSGGMVMACAAEQARERVARVVFADALALFDGEKILDIVKRPTTAVDTPVARGPNRADAVGRLFAGLDPSLREWAADRITLHPAAVYNQPVKLERFWDLPWKASVLYCSQAPNPGEAHIRRAADKLKAKWHVIDTGHYPMLSTPDELTRSHPRRVRRDRVRLDQPAARSPRIARASAGVAGRRPWALAASTASLTNSALLAARRSLPTFRLSSMPVRV